MLNRIVAAVTILAWSVVNVATANVTYKYWFDHNYAEAISVNGNENTSLAIDVNGLTEGIHQLFIYANDEETISSTVCRYFIVMPKSKQYSGNLTYEYWFDDNENDAVIINGSQNMSFEVSTDGLSAGIHHLHIYAKDGNTISSSVNRYFVKLPHPVIVDIENIRCVYGFDDQETYYSEAGMLNNDSFFIDLDARAIQEGEHEVHFALIDPEAGEMSPFYTASFTRDKTSFIGDVDGNSEVNLGDAVMVINHSIGISQDGFIEQVADVDSNGEINIGDAVIIINYSIGAITRFPINMPMHEEGFAKAVAKAVSTDNPSEYLVSVGLDSWSGITAMQMSVNIPEGAEYVSGSMNAASTEGSHVVAVNECGKTVKAALFSPENECVATDGNAILTFLIRTENAIPETYQIDLTNILVADPQGHTTGLDDTNCIFGLPAAVSIEGFDYPAALYLKGNELHVLVQNATVLTIIDMDGVSRKYSMKAGENIILLGETGVYIAICNGTTYKVIVK